ncbi:MAG TPA: phosphatidylglycerol lysyltransferase domain-containing protein, partial [Longimicrobiales bacterium]|nr:phosphatidylglycerol lysyltransferase domain-containing protein [Longimicrobiales bacterium]
SGIAFSLLKGLDYEEATVLALMLAALVASRREFHRRASLFADRFTTGWALAVLGALSAAVVLGLLAYRQVVYTGDLWWRFALDADAPRFLRASVGALAAVLAFGAVRLLAPAGPEGVEPTDVALERVASIAERSPHSYAWLALLGDKSFLFERDAFLMYAVEGRSWISLGDPVGPESEGAELAWTFRERADRHGGWTVFYQVRPENLPLYLDLGLTPTKLGEEARVPLDGFSLEGGRRKGRRRVLRKLQEAGVGFRMLDPGEVASVLPSLKAVSDAWLADKNTREKGFSLGSFREEYVRRTPVAVAERDGRVIAFANVLAGAGREELTVDLMRYDPSAPPGVMEYLFLRLMLRGREEGYRWFNLGMAPLSGLEDRPFAPLTSRLGATLFRHGEHFYHFQGLRDYKQKFDPVWEPRYLASPGGLALPRVLANIASLIGGGLRGVVTR